MERQSRQIVVLFILVFLSCVEIYAWTGKLNAISDSDSPSKNWAIKKYPHIVIALGLLQSEFVGNYASLSFDFFLDARPDVDVKILLFATNAEIIAELQNPQTAGIVFISHNFKTALDTASLLDASYSPIPSDILSAATPALRFAAFIGCHGPDIKKHYQMSYELNRLPGAQTVYYPESSFVTTEDLFFVISSGVKEALTFIANESKEYDFTQGIEPEKSTGLLTIQAKDIVPGIEPRFVILNKKIIGTLGIMKGHEDNANEHFTDFTFTVPHYIFDAETDSQKVSIRSAELSPGAPADDYMISQVQLYDAISQHLWEKTYDPPLHLGDNSTPYIGDSIQMPSSLTRLEDVQQLQQYLKYIEWLDRDPAHWPTTYQRMYLDRILLRQ